MRIVTVYRHGVVGGTKCTPNVHPPSKRAAVQGWSSKAASRNARFLYSVDERELTGYGFALTLTYRRCPDTPVEFHRHRKAFLLTLRRRGLLRVHWVVEWQCRGVPHLHMAAWFMDPVSPFDLVSQWLRITADLDPLPQGQHVAPISDSVGWFQYLSKHAARGISHYQRSPENIPAHWEYCTGRVWGHDTGWPTQDAIRLELDAQGWHRFRRIVGAWRMADARSERDPRKRRARMLAARRFRRITDRSLSNVRGWSEWMPYELTADVLAHLKAQGHTIEG